MKNILFLSMLVACFFLPNNLSAQNDADALRLSNIQFGSTARSISLAGAMGALGADFSTFSKNPAGIGIYRKSEFTFSPLITSRTAKSEYLGNSNELSQTPFGIGNAGLVYAAPLQGGSLWKSINYGFGYNRLNTFKQEFGGDGANKTSSLLDGWIANA
ncbi:MAG: hypothetical protein KJO64_08810, partial [Bacteroidia bacterium]|nr:hypothetical protein [Bacteroidia bacterium]